MLDEYFVIPAKASACEHKPESREFINFPAPRLSPG